MAVFGHNDMDIRLYIYFTVRLNGRKQSSTDENVDLQMLPCSSMKNLRIFPNHKFSLLGTISLQPKFSQNFSIYL